MPEDPTTMKILYDEIKEIKRDIKALIQFRGWVLGAACVAGAVGGLLARML